MNKIFYTISRITMKVFLSSNIPPVDISLNKQTPIIKKLLRKASCAIMKHLRLFLICLTKSPFQIWLKGET